MNVSTVLEWVYNTGSSTAIRESSVLFPMIETIHVLTIALLVGTVAIVDLRLLGAVFRRVPVRGLADQVLPWTWTGFGVMASSGLLLFWAQPVKMYLNPAFRLKLLFLVLAGINPLIFHTTIYRTVDKWGKSTLTPARARAAGAASLLLWTGIIVTGRAIAYF